MSEPTKTDHNGVTEWKLDDVVVQLREWGSEQTYELPTAASGEWLIGTARGCEVRVVDRRRLASRQHARLSRDRGAWTLTDAGSKNCLWLDDARRPSFVLAAGVEVGIGSLRLIAESGDDRRPGVPFTDPWVGRGTPEPSGSRAAVPPRDGDPSLPAGVAR